MFVSLVVLSVALLGGLVARRAMGKLPFTAKPIGA